jgi:DNA-directed RNA polymerase specialized sigma24 family protein
MGKRERFVDFFYVAPHQQEMHRRLENWAQAQFSGGGSSASPMFRLYRPDNFERGTPGIPVDTHDAMKVAKGVAALPQPHRLALNWNYVEGGSPTKARKLIGCTVDGLMLLISDGRQMLLNRGV